MLVFTPNLRRESPAISLGEGFYSEIPNDIVATTVSWPGAESKLVLDIPHAQEHTVMTRGLIVCSGVSVGFVNDNGDRGMYMSHTYSDMAEMASRALNSVIDLSKSRGYVPVFIAMLSRKGAAGREYRDLVTPIFKDIEAQGRCIQKEVTTYKSPSDWVFKIGIEGKFGVERTRYNFRDQRIDAGR